MLPSDIYLTLGQQIRSLRERYGMSRKQLALASGLGEAYINKVERGNRRVSIEAACKIATALDVTLSDLFQTL